jgi:hypothetical protein
VQHLSQRGENREVKVHETKPGWRRYKTGQITNLKKLSLISQLEIRNEASRLEDSFRKAGYPEGQRRPFNG